MTKARAQSPGKSSGADDAQRRASDPEASVWVSANAGSGKTHALTTRVARLLLVGNAPERILCLTFTKAAAAEMSARLYKRLGDWAMMDDRALAAEILGIEGKAPDAAMLREARKLFARAIETPGGLKIQTIHAFCERLLGRFPLEAGVPPHFDILDERAATELMADVRDAVLRRAGREEGTALSAALAHVVARVDELAFGNLLKEITSQRGNFSELMEGFGGLDGIRAALRHALSVGPDETVEGLRAAIASLPEAAMRSAVAVLSGGTKTDVERAEILFGYLETSEDRTDALEDYLSVFLTQKNEPRKSPMTAKRAGEHPQAAEALYAEQQRVLGLYGRMRAVAVAEATEAILTLAVAILDTFRETKRARALLDYDDLISATRDLLTRSRMAAWVLYKLDSGIDHILVDEAQDTSPDQWDVIAALADEFLAGHGARERVRTIFAVGDEKQSIFSFQGADPARFDAMKRYFEKRVKAAERKWDYVPLTRSFRSVPEVLSAVDKVFALAHARDGLTASGDMDDHIAFRAKDAGLVEIWPLEVKDDNDDPPVWDAPLNYMSETAPMAKLAARIASTIKGWLVNEEPLAGRGRPIRPGDILILVRRRNAFVAEMVRHLKEQGIAVARRRSHGADRADRGDGPAGAGAFCVASR